MYNIYQMHNFYKLYILRTNIIVALPNTEAGHVKSNILLKFEYVIEFMQS